jgi:two-component system response regulator LytT
VRDEGSLRVLIVDDEKPARNDIARILKKIQGIEIAGEAGNGIEAVERIEELDPDILLLDIRMPGLDGFQVVEKISGFENAPSVIFVTAYDSHAIKAFEVHAADYILKPVDEKRLAEAIERAARIRRGLEKSPDLDALLEALGGVPRRFAVKRNDSLVMVDMDDILYATSSGGEVRIVTDGLEGVSSYRSLDELQRELPPSIFIRVHRSYLANIKQIHEIRPWFSGSYQMRMSHGKGPVIPLSRGYAKDLRRILKW